MNDLPLAGLRVLDLSNLFACPMATMFLADFGAEVIKVEHPVRGDEMRRWGERKDDVGLFFKVVNRNKKAITLDLSTPEGRDIVLQLAAESDVVAENYRTGTLEKWGLGYKDLVAVNEDIIMLHVTGFGQNGPRAKEAGFGSLAEAYSGAAYVSGYVGGRPMIQSFGLGDASTAIFGAFATLVALRNRDEFGGGQEIDLALYEGLFTMLGAQVINYDQLGIVQERLGGDSPFVAPRGTFQTGDGHWVAVSGSTQATFARICAALRLEALLDDDRFNTNVARTRHAEELNRVIGAAVQSFDRETIIERAQEFGATIGPVNSVADAFQDPQFLARENIVTVPDDELGSVRMQAVPVKLSRTPGRISHAGPRKGEHNDAIFSKRLGMSRTKIEELRARKVL